MGYYTLNCGLIGKGRTTNTGVLNLDRSRFSSAYVYYGLQLHLDASDSNSYPGSGTTWYDLSGNGRHGEIEGNPTYTATPGYFDITSDNTYVDIPNDGLSPGAGDYTYSMWIKFDSFNSGDEIFSNGRYSTTGIQVRTSSNRLFLYHNGNSVGYYDTGGVTDGEWVNFVFVRENGVGKFYYDGALKDTLNDTGMSDSIYISPSYPDLRLMRSVRYNNDNVDGKIAQFSVYDRALSLEEVLKNYGYFGSRFIGPPVLTSSTPANGSTNHPGNFAIFLGFSSELATGTGNIVIKKSSDNSIFETISATSNQVHVTDDELSIIIEPSSTLVDGTQYYINIDSTAFYQKLGLGYYAGISDTTTLSFTAAAAVIGFVANDLEIHLDAGDSNSYSGSGITWSDLSGNGNDATLINGPTFNSGLGGYFDLDGYNDCVSETSSLTDSFLQNNWTISFWVNFDTINSGSSWHDGKSLLQHGTSTNLRGLHLTQEKNSVLTFGLWGSDLDGPLLSTSTWYNIAFTLDNTSYVKQIYMNGVLTDSHTGSGPYIGTATNHAFGRASFIGDNFDGKMSVISTYSRVLTSSEIYHNYTLDRDRHFIPTLTSSIPANGSTNHPGNFGIYLAFGHLITVGTGNVVIKKSSDNSIFETISVTSNQVTGNGTNSIQIQPSSTLVDGTQYYINIDATAFSNNGVYYAGISDTTTLSFTAAAAVTGPVTTDLLLHLDAYDNGSYSGSGDTWIDLSDNANDATRTSSSEVVYNSNGWFDWTDGPSTDSTKGCFTLPNDSFTLGANFTIEVWNYYDSTSAPSTNPWSGGNLWTNSASTDWNSGAGSNNGLLFGYNSMKYRNTSNSETQLTYSSNPTTQVWHQHVLVVDSGTATVYVDKNSVGTVSDFRTYTQSNGDLGIGIADKYISNYRGEYLGFISIVRIYQKSLTSSEILQNYNAHKGRYGL